MGMLLRRHRKPTLNLEKLSVKELKEIAKSKDIDTKLHKDELIEAIKNADRQR